MSDQKLNQFKTALFAMLDETFTSNYHTIYLDEGASLFETLEGVTAEMASQPVSGRCSTIAAQVQHVSYYLDVLEKYTLSQEIGPVDWEKIWKEAGPVTEAEWTEIQNQLKTTYERVRASLEGLENWEGDRAIGGALGIVVHTAYHLGEIRQALCTIG